MAVHTYNPSTIPSPPSPSPSPASAMSTADLPPDANQSYIAIWGPKSSGKTMFLFMLRDEMRMSNSEWEMNICSEAANKFWEKLTELKFQHRFAEATTAQSPEEIVIEFKRQDHRHNTWEYRYVKVRDLPGEWYQDRFQVPPDPDGTNPVDEYLKKCKGLLCLVDPNAKPEDLSKYFDKLLMRLQMLCGQPTDKRLAICLTKMDERAHRQQCHNPTGYVQQILGSAVMSEIYKTFRQDKIKCFPSSAIGLYPGASVERSNSGIDWRGNPIIYEVRNIKPFGLFAPFCDWLFQD